MNSIVSNNNNCIFSENDMKISDYVINESKVANVYAGDTCASSNNGNSSTALNVVSDKKIYEVTMQNKILKKKAKIKMLKQKISELTNDNEVLKNKLNQQSNYNNISNEQVEALKNQIMKYEQSLNETSVHYQNQIESFQKKFNDYMIYLNLVNKFLDNVANYINSNSTNASVAGLVHNKIDIHPHMNVDSDKNDNNCIQQPVVGVHLPPEQFQSVLTQIENYVYEISKEAINTRLKYNKLLEMNNKLLHNNSNTNNNNNNSHNNSNLNITGLEYHQMQPFSNVENVFENNYESSNRAKENTNSNNDININTSPIPSSPLQVPKLYEIGNYTPNHHNSSNNKITIEQLEIYKTLEQRVNMLERELNMQKMNNNSKHYSSNSSLHTIANTCNNTNSNINNEKIRPKSGGKYKYANEMGDMWNLNNNEQNDIVGITPVPIMEKPKKTTKKKKKNHTKVNKRDNNFSHAHSNVVNTNMTNNDGKGSLCSNISYTNNKNNRNNNNNMNRCITPIHSRKIGLNRNNSNNNNIQVCKSKGGHLNKKVQY